MTSTFLVLFVSLCLSFGSCSVGKEYRDMGLGFDETMQGFGAFGDLDYQTAYNKGKQQNAVVQISLSIGIDSMQKFLSDPNHFASANGTIIVFGLTSSNGVVANDGSFLRIFDGGIENHTLELHYFVPFTALDGRNFSLQGVKYVYGDNCIHFLAEATTLYVHIHEGQIFGEGKINSTAIIMIDDLEIIALALSLKFIGNGTDADKLNCILSFGDFLLGDVYDVCSNITDFENDFWYVWGSDGQTGFLLDLIKRPDEYYSFFKNFNTNIIFFKFRLELRLEIYNISSSPNVYKQYLSLDQFSQTGSDVTMGPLFLSPSLMKGKLNDINLSGIFSLDNTRHMVFCPAWIEESVDEMIPDVQSTYGLLKQANVGPATLQNVPMAYTTYPVKMGLSLLQWTMISALTFQGTDLQIEMVASFWISSVYVYYQGQNYYLNEPMLFESSLINNGQEENGKRLFGVRFHSWSISGELNCSAPTSQFALLDKEGSTQILTTVLGTCVATIGGKTFNSGPTALLETKQPIN